MRKQQKPVLLASASPRRAELLRGIGVDFGTVIAATDETPLAGEDPGQYTARLALAKARAGRQAALLVDASARDAVVLGADTIVTIDGELLGKPRDEADARRMWRAIGGRRHEVITAVAAVDELRSQVKVVATSVWFDALAEDDMVLYWASGEPRDKAGAYGIQGLGALFVARIDGSYSGVVGLPLRETWALLREFAVV